MRIYNNILFDEIFDDCQHQYNKGHLETVLKDLKDYYEFGDPKESEMTDDMRDHLGYLRHVYKGLLKYVGREKGKFGINFEFPESGEVRLYNEQDTSTDMEFLCEVLKFHFKAMNRSDYFSLSYLYISTTSGEISERQSGAVFVSKIGYEIHTLSDWIDTMERKLSEVLKRE